MLKNKKKRLLFVGTTFAISILALFFVIINFRDNIVFFYSPSELVDKKILSKIQDGQQFRIGGLVKKGSVNKINSLEVEFIITDNNDEILINYRGILPDLFRQGQGIVAKGYLDFSKNKFYSRELLVKHDEKYVPPEIKSISVQD